MIVSWSLFCKTKIMTHEKFLKMCIQHKDQILSNM